MPLPTTSVPTPPPYRPWRPSRLSSCSDGRAPHAHGPSMDEGHAQKDEELYEMLARTVLVKGTTTDRDPPTADARRLLRKKSFWLRKLQVKKEQRTAAPPPPGASIRLI